MATHTLADNTRKTTLTISGSETIIFPTKLNWFGVRSLDGADILASKLAAPTQLADGVYSTDEGDGDIIIDDGVFTDTLYLNGTGKVVVFGGVKDSRNPFNIGVKGGDSTHYKGTTTTALSDGATTNPITIDGKSYTAVKGDIVIYNSTEFIFDGSAWQSFGGTMDTQPTLNSAKAVTSDGVYRYTAGKKDLSSDGEIFNSYSGMYANSASGNYSHAEGRSNSAYGNNSHVEGYSCSTHGEATNSHAEGNTTLAYGQASHAEGGFTQAIGDYSHAGGRGTYAMTEASTVIGTYNVPDNSVENLFIVGNGGEDSQGNVTQSNILEVSKTALNVNGDIKKNGTAIAALAFKSSASGTALVNAGTLPSLIYDSANERLIFDAGTLPTTGTVTVS